MGKKIRYNGLESEFCVMQKSGARTETREGAAKATAEFFIYPESALERYAPVIGSTPHPVFDGLICSALTLTKKDGGYVVSANYEGSSYTITMGEDENKENGITIALSSTCNEEPIETHPKFEAIAGTPSAPLAGLFNDKKQFIGWNPETPNGKLLLGVKGYLSPRTNMKISYKSKVRVSFAGIGETSATPARYCTTKAGTQWLLTGIDMKQAADGTYEITESYMLSGAKGWNSLIYD